MSLIDPPRWNEDELDEQIARSLEAFREERVTEPVEQYRHIFDEFAARVRTLLAVTDNLSTLQDASPELLANEDTLDTLRYLAGPPISADDLKTLSGASLAPSRLRDDPAATKRILDTVLASLDTKRFPWLEDHRHPDSAELRAAAVASASLMATQRVQTDRRNSAKTDRRNTAKSEQEDRVAHYLTGIGMRPVEPREINTHSDAPASGSFCGESLFGGRKADLVVHLHDGRLMPIECKVSNSATNSVKRLNNDAAAKASAWTDYFGRGQTVPSAVLSGVFKRHNVVQAQEAGLTIFWAHDLQPLGDFILTAR